MKNKYCSNCSNEVFGWGALLCRKCEDERKRKETPRADKNWNWKGNNAGLSAKHRWLDRNYGQPRFCEHCFTTEAKFFDWANLSGKYKRVRSDYKRLCRKCHIRMDRGKIMCCINGHEYTPENTIMETEHHRRCRICKKAKNNKYYLKSKEK